MSVISNSPELDYRNLIQIAEHTDNLIVVTDKSGVIEWVNESFTKTTEYTLAEAVGKKPGRLLQGKETSPKDVLTLREKLGSQQPFSHRILNYSKSGRKYWLHLSITPIFNDLGELVNFLAIQSEINDKNESPSQLEEALAKIRHMESQLEELTLDREELSKSLMMAELKFKSTFKQEKNISDTLTKARSELTATKEQLTSQEKLATIGLLTAGIAHEMNNPINFVSNGVRAMDTLFGELMEMLEAYDEILQDKLPKEGLEAIENLKEEFEFEDTIEDMKAMIADIHTGAKRTMEIAKGLRVFARTDEDEQSETGINELLESTLILLTNKFKDRIEVEKNFQQDLPPIICFPGPLNQVFMNLINNAIQAIPEDRKDGKVSIITGSEKGYQVIRIKDNGSGIPEDLKQRIFEPFFTTKPVGVGTGLGMSISREIITEKHGGQMTFTSEVGIGTEFLVKLPTA
ncbi:MAG: PAS domain-containing protein [Cyclobacteriaceae bacterium]|nr:PAS domain-containing protein [Cyclobacteriaceae bacterium HetDA_MAG_MS6]